MSDYEPQRDPLTGADTCIDSPATRPERREARARLNRRRTSALFEGGTEAASDQSASLDAWAADFSQLTRERGLTFVRSSGLGLWYDGEQGKWLSEFLVPLKPGAEAIPFLDRQRGVVYKLFDLREGGNLGKKLISSRVDSGSGWDVTLGDSNLFETLEKLALLDEAGALPTEIVGLLDSGDNLLVKQPQADVNPGWPG